MKNKKDFLLLFILSLIVAFCIFKLADTFYFLEYSKIVDVKTLGYKQSLIVFKSKQKLLLFLTLLSFGFAGIVYTILKKRQDVFDQYLRQVKDRLEKISRGDYSMNIGEMEKLGDLYDDLYKLVLELKEKGDQNYQDKLEIKKSLEDIAHQLKTPLASMEIMLDLEKMEGDKSYLKKLEEEVEKMTYLISSLLALARFDVNEVRLHYREVYIRDLLLSSLESLDSILEREKIEVDVNGPDFSIQGDFSWLVEAFINILQNSLNYGERKIQIHLARNQTYKEVRIQDDGPGFQEGDLQKIFHRFYKADEDSPGVGIGLNLAKTILEKHNASIVAENREGGLFIIKFYED